MDDKRPFIIYFNEPTKKATFHTIFCSSVMKRVGKTPPSVQDDTETLGIWVDTPNGQYSYPFSKMEYSRRKKTVKESYYQCRTCVYCNPEQFI